MEGLDATTRELVPELIDEVLAAGGAVLVSDHRGETVRLPGARRWTVADGTVTEETSPPDGTIAVIEVVVPAARAAGTVARLRAEGHQVLRVRTDARPAPPPARPGGDDRAPDEPVAVDGPGVAVDRAAGEAR